MTIFMLQTTDGDINPDLGYFMTREAAQVIADRVNAPLAAVYQDRLAECEHQRALYRQALYRQDEEKAYQVASSLDYPPLPYRPDLLEVIEIREGA